MSNFDWTNPTVVRVIERVTAVNRKVTPQDCEQSRTLREVAEYYAANYVGIFDYMVSMFKAMDRWGKLTPAQAAGTLNCLMADWCFRQEKATHKPFVMPEAELPADISTSALDRRAAPEHEVPPSGFRITDTEREASLDRLASSDNKLANMLAATVRERDQMSVTPTCLSGTYTVILNQQGEYRVIRLVDANDKMNKPAGTQIAQYQSGPDNESNYTGFAFISGTRVGMWAKFRTDSMLAKALEILLAAPRDRQVDMGEAYAIESSNCFICGCKLTVPASLHRGCGPICAEKYGIK